MGSHRLDLFRHGVDIIVTEDRQASERLSTGKHSSLIMTPDYLAQAPGLERGDLMMRGNVLCLLCEWVVQK
jgi:hypothetical protein